MRWEREKAPRKKKRAEKMEMWAGAGWFSFAPSPLSSRSVNSVQAIFHFQGIFKRMKTVPKALNRCISPSRALMCCSCERAASPPSTARAQPKCARQFSSADAERKWKIKWKIATLRSEWNECGEMLSNRRQHRRAERLGKRRTRKQRKDNRPILH